MGARDDAARHPATAELEAFARGSLPDSALKPVVAHLLRGCAACSAALEPLLRAAKPRGLARPRPEGVERAVRTSREEEAGYDFFIARAFVTARKEAAALATARAEAEEDLERAWEGQPLPGGSRARPDLWRRGLSELLLAGSRALQRSRPEAALMLAGLGWAAADSTAPETADPSHLADLQAEVLGELGNAHRVNSDPRQAERVLSQALDRALEGTVVDPLLFARLMDLTASTYAAQRRFLEAFQLLDWAFHVYQANGDPRLAARALISKGLYLGYANETEEAIRVLAQALGRIGGRDRAFTLYAVHNLLVFLADAGRFVEARRHLEVCRALFATGTGGLDAYRLRALEGRIEAGFGDLETAEQAFLEAREGLERQRMPAEAAIVSLDLAAVWLRQGRNAEILEMVEETLETFRAIGIRREATAAVLVLRRALLQDRASASLLKAVAKRLQRLERR